MTTPPLWRSPWPLRLVWLAAPVSLGPSLAAALDERSRSVQVVGSAMAWSLWAVTLLALLVPRAATLTVVRVIVPGAAAVALWSAAAGDGNAWSAVAVGTGALGLIALAVPGLSDAFVDGSSYGSERRVALRVPYLLLIGPAPLAWVAVAAGVVAGPLLLASGTWLAGATAMVVGAAVAVIGIRQLHLLSRRWLVFVPAGVVVHDPLTLAEPVLFQRHLIRTFAPAPADSDALDATGGALGLVLEIRSAEPFAVGVRQGRERVERDGVEALLVTPTQPATTLAVAAAHRLPVG